MCLNSGCECNNDPPEADFSAPPAIIRVGQSVTFTDYSNSSPAIWDWDFEGGTPSSFSGQIPPPVTYNSVGKFDVSLYVENSNGSDINTRPDYITVLDTIPIGCDSDSTVTDSEGNVYRIVKIGSQCWMAENLRSTAGIAEVSNTTQWGDIFTSQSRTPAWCYYENDSSNNALYGKLYNWHAVNTGNLCPTGWHIPTQQEWQTLIDLLALQRWREASSSQPPDGILPTPEPPTAAASPRCPVATVISTERFFMEVPRLTSGLPPPRMPRRQTMST